MKRGLAKEFRERRATTGVRQVADKTIATVRLRGIAEMTPEGRRGIAEWLQRQAQYVQDDGPKMAPIYTARYFAR